MRADAIPALLLIALLGFALAPQASADTAAPAWLPVCHQYAVEQGPIRGGVDDCRQDHETTTCSNGATQRIHHYEEVGGGIAWVQVHYCFPHTPPPTLSAASAPEPPVCGPTQLCEVGCPAHTVASDVDHHNEVTLEDDCSVFVQTGKGQICMGAWSAHETRQVGPVTWDRYYCRFPGGTPIELTAASAASGPCGAANPMQRCPAPVGPCQGIAGQGSDPPGAFGVRRDVSSNCSVRVYVKADVMDCLWGEGWNAGPSAGPVQVYTWGCKDFDPSSSMMADPFPTCVRDCSPVHLPSGCELQASTPESLGLLGLRPRALVWGGYDPYECDIDVDPIAACAPPSGSTVERDIDFVSVRLLLCDGGLPPIVAASAPALQPPMLLEAMAADLPDLPGPPTFPVCVTEPCPVMVCDRAEDTVGGVHYEFTQSCRVIVTLPRVPCENPQQVRHDAGPVTVVRTVCGPGYPE